MNPIILIQIIYIREFVVACITIVKVLSCMYPMMFIQGIYIREFNVTVITL